MMVRRVAPSRERGSKPSPRASGLTSPSVAPSRERGSKPVKVRVFMAENESLPHGSVDRNPNSKRGWLGNVSSLPHGSVDRNSGASEAEAVEKAESLPHGSVDRNGIDTMAPVLPWRRSLTGAWIETGDEHARTHAGSVAPSRERGSKPLHRGATGRHPQSLPHGSVDRNLRPQAGQLQRIRVAPSRERGSKPPLSNSVEPTNRSLPHGSVDRNCGRRVMVAPVG